MALLATDTGPCVQLGIAAAQLGSQPRGYAGSGSTKATALRTRVELKQSGMSYIFSITMRSADCSIAQYEHEMHDLRQIAMQTVHPTLQIPGYHISSSHLSSFQR